MNIMNIATLKTARRVLLLLFMFFMFFLCRSNQDETRAHCAWPTSARVRFARLLDHGEEDRGGTVELKHCPHVAARQGTERISW